MDTPVDIVDRMRVLEIDRDGCDHCGPHVTAYVFAEMPNGLPLSYCGSCGTRYLPELRRQAARVFDYRYMREP